MRLTRNEFETTFDRVPYTDVAARRSLVEKAFMDGLLDQRARQIWMDRITAEAAPMKQNVIEIPIGYVQTQDTPDPTRPNNRAMPPIRNNPDGVQEFRKHAGAQPPPRRAAGKNEGYTPIGGDLEWRP